MGRPVLLHMGQSRKNEFLSIHMRRGWRQSPPDGMGGNSPTKQVLPRNLDETRQEPTRSLLVLRAWALWRARQGGWAQAQRGRARYFREQEDLIVREVQALGAPGQLLGNSKADALLRAWAPEVVERLLRG